MSSESIGASLSQDNLMNPYPRFQPFRRSFEVSLGNSSCLYVFSCRLQQRMDGLEKMIFCRSLDVQVSNIEITSCTFFYTFGASLVWYLVQSFCVVSGCILFFLTLVSRCTLLSLHSCRKCQLCWACTIWCVWRFWSHKSDWLLLCSILLIRCAWRFRSVRPNRLYFGNIGWSDDFWCACRKIIGYWFLVPKWVSIGRVILDTQPCTSASHVCTGPLNRPRAKFRGVSRRQKMQTTIGYLILLLFLVILSLYPHFLFHSSCWRAFCNPWH